MQTNCTPASATAPAVADEKRITITLFPRGEMSRGRALTLTVAQLHQLFRSGSKARTKAELGSWSPATYHRNHRRLEHLISTSFAVLDIDNSLGKVDGVEHRVPDDQTVTIDHVLSVLTDIDTFIYTSFRHRPEWPKFRVVMPLDRPVNAAEYAKFSAVFEAMLKQHGINNDPKARDASHLWYLGSQHAEHFECTYQPGRPIAVGDYLALYREPPKPVRVVSSIPNVDSERKVERARRYLVKCPPGVSGAGGHARTFSVCCSVIRGFDLSEGEAWQVMSEWNNGCDPPWSDRELQHKIDEARTKGMAPEIGEYLDPSRRPTRVVLSESEREIIKKARAK